MDTFGALNDEHAIGREERSRGEVSAVLRLYEAYEVAQCRALREALRIVARVDALSGAGMRHP
jgi:hypothetical protein